MLYFVIDHKERRNAKSISPKNERKINYGFYGLLAAWHFRFLRLPEVFCGVLKKVKGWNTSDIALLARSQVVTFKRSFTLWKSLSAKRFPPQQITLKDSYRVVEVIRMG